MKTNLTLVILATCLRFAFLGQQNANAAGSSATGAIEGRVLNIRTGEFLERARITVEGTSLETFTAAGGQFRIGPISGGPVTLRVFFTGLDPLTETVNVPAGQIVQRDFNLGATTPGAADSGVVKLSEFVVGASREM